MSERRTLLSRPRTRVYDCNYNIGEGYYKPMMDHLDRKYYGSSAAPAAAKPATGFFDSSPKSLFGTSGSSAFDEYRSSSPARSRRSGSDSRLSLPDDEFEQEVNAFDNILCIDRYKLSMILLCIQFLLNVCWVYMMW